MNNDDEEVEMEEIDNRLKKLEMILSHKWLKYTFC